MNTLIARIALCALVAAVENGHAADFTNALAQAYASNPDLLIARSQLAATDETVALSLAARRPTVNTLLGAGPAVFEKWPFSPQDNPGAREIFRYQQQIAGVFVSQALYRGGALDGQLAGAEAQVLAGRATLHDKEQQVLIAAANAWLNLWLAESQRQVRIEHERDLKQLLAFNRSRFARHDITITDLGQTETRAAQASADRVQSENAVSDARIAYRVVIGSDPDELDALPPVVDQPTTLEQALASAAEHNPALVAARHGAQAAASAIEVQRAGARPTVDLAYQKLSMRGPSAGTPRLDQESSLVNFGLSLYQGGAVDARVRSAEALADKARSSVDESRRNAVRAVEDAWTAVVVARETCASFRIQVGAAQTALEGVDREAARGDRTVLDRLNAREELTNARLSLDQAERDHRIAALQLLAATGTLSAETLKLPVRLHDPAEHYRHARERVGDRDDAP